VTLRESCQLLAGHRAAVGRQQRESLIDNTVGFAER